MGGLTFLIIFLILMTLVAIVPKLLMRFHFPAVVSIMLVGIIIGPQSLNIIGWLNDILGRGYPTDQFYLILDSLGLLGLVFLMALAGMEVDLRLLLAERKAVILLSVLTFIIPAIAGYYIYGYFMKDDTIGKLLYASLFASHSVGIVFPVIRELKVVRTRFGLSVLASTVITDLASLVLLAVCVQMKRHSFNGSAPGSLSIFDKLDMSATGPMFIMIFISVIMVYIALSLWLTPKCARIMFKNLHPQDDSRLTFFLVTVLVVVLLGELIGVNIIVGAFVAGMAMVSVPQFHDHSKILTKKIEGIGYGILIPFLFLTIGMNTDMSILFNAGGNMVIVIVTVIGLVGSKVFSGWLAMRLAGFSNHKGVLAGLMTIPQLSATLAAAAVGLQLQIIDARFFNAIVCLSIITTLPVPTLVKILINKWKVPFTGVEESLANLIPEEGPDEDAL